MKKHRTPPSFLHSDSEISGTFVPGRINRHRRNWHYQRLSSLLLRVSLGLVLLMTMGMLGACTAVAPTPVASAGIAATGEATAAAAGEQSTQTLGYDCSIDIQNNCDSGIRAGLEVEVPQLDSTTDYLIITVPQQDNRSTYRVRLLPWDPDVPMDEGESRVVNFEIVSTSEETITKFVPAVQLNVECPVNVCTNSTPTASLEYFDEGTKGWVPFAPQIESDKDGTFVYIVAIEQWGDRHIAWKPDKP